MRVNNALSGYTDSMRPNGRAESANGGGERKPLDKLFADLALGGGPTDSVREILTQYDVTAITPRQLTKMLTELHDNGALTDDQFKELSQIQSVLDKEGIEPDESIDLVDFFTTKLQRLLRDMNNLDPDNLTSLKEARQSLPAIQNQLDWVQKFAIVQANPNETSLDAMV